MNDGNGEQRTSRLITLRCYSDHLDARNYCRPYRPYAPLPQSKELYGDVLSMAGTAVDSLTTFNTGDIEKETDLFCMKMLAIVLTAARK